MKTGASHCGFPEAIVTVVDIEKRWLAKVNHSPLNS
jgi:hypothetical protein